MHPSPAARLCGASEFTGALRPSANLGLLSSPSDLYSIRALEVLCTELSQLPPPTLLQASPAVPQPVPLASDVSAIRSLFRYGGSTRLNSRRPYSLPRLESALPPSATAQPASPNPMDRSQYARFRNRDSVVAAREQSAPRAIRRKVSRAFSSLVRRGSQESLEASNTSPAPKMLGRLGKSMSSLSLGGSTSGSSASRSPRLAPASPSTITMTPREYYAHPISRVDPVLLGFFVCL